MVLVDDTVNAPTAYRTPDTDMALDDDMVAAPTATRWPEMLQDEDAETLKDAVLTTVAATETVDDAATVNAPTA
jgi:hypothetical protein